ncbi:hypothetical protein [Bdellovibrio sp. HCB337]|uniref:hypothetical protein n=1 Tax=Bdellovibrio sp. HCB337 TaxID=3394358 RepID=UPI0039A43593
MKQVLCITAITLMVAGCGMIEMPQKMDKTNENMELMIQNMNHTNSGIDKQSKLIPFENLLKAENTENLTPIPTRLMPFGKELALVISAEDMVELTYLWLKEIDEVYPDHKVDANGNELPYSTEEIGKINHDKLARLVGLQIIAGFLPHATVEQIIHKQIHTGGRYEDVAYAILMMRSQFVRDVLLEASLLASPLNNSGKVAQAVEYNKSLDYLARLPFAKKIAVKTRGFIPAENSPEETFNPEIALINWKRIQSAAEQDWQVTPESITGDSVQDQAIYQQKQNSYKKSLAEIQSYIKSWTGQN